MYLYSIVPFFTLTLIDLFLIYVTVLSHWNKFKASSIHTQKNMRKKLNMTRTVIILNLAFIITTLPSAIVSGYYFITLMNTDYGVLIITLCDNITFSFHSFNILTLYFSNKRFKKELRNVFFYKCLKSKVNAKNSRSMNLFNLTTTY